MTEGLARWPLTKWVGISIVGGLLAIGGCNEGGAAPAKEAASAPASEKASATKTTTPKEGESVAIVAIDEFIAQQDIDKSNDDWKTQLPKPPQVEFPGGETYYWMLNTNVGDIKVKLLPEIAPMHVSSTIYLTRLGFYDDIIFHRVITGFMAQGGDPLGKGFGGPGYKYAGEFSPDARHDRPGMLSMANAGPGTDGSQFFLTFVPTPHLDGKHTIFGEVVDGMDTVKTLESRGSRSGKTTEPLIIEQATIVVE